MFLNKFHTLSLFIRTPLLFLFSLFSFFGIERLCHLATEGFALVKITSPLPTEGEFTPPILQAEEKQSLLHILSQPFYYLSCGGQSFVFVSSDGHYVIKFLKFHRRRIPLWLQKIPLPRNLEDYRLSKITKELSCLERNLRSYVISYNHFKEESGILYHHLQKTAELHSHLSFFDKLGYRYTINLDDYAFVVQKRGVSTRDMLANLLKEGKTQEIKEKFYQLIDFSIRRCQKGVGDSDFKFKSNLGFIDGLPSQIDLGSLFLDEKQKEPEVYKTKIAKSAKHFRRWLEKHYPFLVEDFDQAMTRLSDKEAG